MADDQGASAKPEQTAEQMEIQQQAKRLAREKGLDWKAMSVDERKELKRTARQEMRSKRA